VTDADSQTVVQLNDGGTIELGPRTMVKLVFETRVDWTRPFQALKRQARVEVVSGAAKTTKRQMPITLVTPQRQKTERAQLDRSTLEAVRPIESTPPPIVVPPVIEVQPAILLPPPPKPKPLPPKPIQLKVSALDYGSAVKFNPLFHPQAIPLTAQWMIDKAVPLDVRLIDKASGKTIFSKTVEPSAKQVQTSVKRPGQYEWTFTHDKRLLGRTSVTVPKRIEGAIQILEPLIAGQKTRSTEYTGVHLKNFDLTLRWKLESNVQYLNRAFDAFRNGHGRSAQQTLVVSEGPFVLTGTFHGGLNLFGRRLDGFREDRFAARFVNEPNIQGHRFVDHPLRGERYRLGVKEWVEFHGTSVVESRHLQLNRLGGQGFWLRGRRKEDCRLYFDHRRDHDGRGRALDRTNGLKRGSIQLGTFCFLTLGCYQRDGHLSLGGLGSSRDDLDSRLSLECLKRSGPVHSGFKNQLNHRAWAQFDGAAIVQLNHRLRIRIGHDRVVVKQRRLILDRCRRSRVPSFQPPMRA
jgi:hypothetical protein